MRVDSGRVMYVIPASTNLSSPDWMAWAGRVVALLHDRFSAAAGHPLPRLGDVHPGAGLAPHHWHGLVAVAVSDIVGTASYSGRTRQRDFRPTRGHVPADWQGRWNRLEAAARDLTPLPPLELLMTEDGYWVVDGHNRVAIAKAAGQIWIDADVTELLLPSTARRPGLVHGGIA